MTVRYWSYGIRRAVHTGRVSKKGWAIIIMPLAVGLKLIDLRARDKYYIQDKTPVSI